MTEIENELNDTRVFDVFFDDAIETGTGIVCKHLREFRENIIRASSDMMGGLGYAMVPANHGRRHLRDREMEFLIRGLHSHLQSSLTENGWGLGSEDCVNMTTPLVAPWSSLSYIYKDEYREFFKSFNLKLRDSRFELSYNRDSDDGSLLNKMNGVKWFDGEDIPIIVSVTGSSKLVVDDAIRDIIKKMFNDLKNSYKHTRIVLLTSLYAGAEIAVARCALDNGVLVAPVFPISFTKYISLMKKTIRMEGGDESVYETEICDILQNERCLDPYDLNLDYLFDEQCDDNSLVFRYLSLDKITHTHLLISLWDGEAGDNDGGPYDTTRMALLATESDLKNSYKNSISYSVTPCEVNYFDATDDCPVYWIREKSIGNEKTLHDSYLMPKSMDGYEGDFEYGLDIKSFFQRKLIEKDMIGRINNIPDEKICEYKCLPKPYTTILGFIDGFNKQFCKPESDFIIGSRLNDKYAKTMDKARSNYYYGLHQPAPDSKKPKQTSNEKKKVGIKVKEKIDSFKNIITRKNHECDGDGAGCKSWSCTEKIENCGSFEALARRFAISDVLSYECQCSTIKELKILAITTIISTALFSLIMLTKDSLIIYGAYALVAVLLAGFRFWHKFDHSFNRYLDYRCLSEYYRVEYYRSIMGNRNPFCPPSYGYLRNELFWVRFTMKGWNAYFANRDSYMPYNKGINPSYITKKCWVEGQKTYHESKSRKNGRLLNKYNTSFAIIAATVALLSIILVLTNYWRGLTLFTIKGWSMNGIELTGDFDLTVGMCLKLLMIVLVALEGYMIYAKNRVFGGTPNEIKAKVILYDSALIQYHNIERTVVDDNNAKSEKEAKLSKLFYALGDVAIDEVNDWVFEHKSRDFKKGSHKTDTET